MLFAGFFGLGDLDGGSDPPLANEPATRVEAVGGPLGDYAHDEAALARATAMATSDNPVMFSHILLRQSSCLGYRWIRVWAIVQDGRVTLYANQAAAAPLKGAMELGDCLCEVGEREECKTDHYCFRLVHSGGAATICTFSSKDQLLWLQALQRSGVKYEDKPLDLPPGVSSLFQLSATLLDGSAVDLGSRYRGCVCLVVNVASK